MRVAVPVSDTSTLPWFESRHPHRTSQSGCHCRSWTQLCAGVNHREHRRKRNHHGTFALTVNLPMWAILLDRMCILIRLPCFQPVLCVDDGPWGFLIAIPVRTVLRFAASVSSCSTSAPP